MRLRFLLLLAAATGAFGQPQARVLDLTHYSHVFGEERNFRIFLPPDYDTSGKRYPVVYFFHGFGERHNKPPGRGGYDEGEGYKGDNIAAFVARNDLIVVKWDGYNPRTPGEAYPRPYNVYPVETYRQFPLYFPELVNYIDSHYRTIPDREHRGTSGLSMGGFMSFWVAGKYPQLVGSASNFMGSSEFWAGPNGFPSEYRHTEMYPNYEGMRTRIVMGTKDFIRWYHRRMNAIWDYTRPYHEHEIFESEHGTPGMAKTLAFHMAAFKNPLPKPSLWHHIDVYPTFDVWGYSVSSDRTRSGYTLLENVSSTGFRSSVREWLPDGRLMRDVTLRIATDKAYKPGAEYAITDVNLETGEVSRTEQKADADGRLHVAVDGARHEIGITEMPRAVLTVAGWKVAGAPWAVAGKPVRIALSVLNKGNRSASGIAISVRTPNPNVTFGQSKLGLKAVAAGAMAPVPEQLVFTVHDPDREIVRLNVQMKDAQGDAAEVPIEIPLFRDAPVLADFAVLDGRTVPYWKRAVEKTEAALGVGNGDGTANPGETVAIAFKDKDAYRGAELFTSDSCVDLRNRTWDPWAAYDHVGATAKVSLPVISSNCPEGHEIPFFIRYQVPNAPEHILKEGVIRVKVAGRDTTAPQVAWADVNGWNRLTVALSDGARIKTALATLNNGGSEIRVPLNDAGLQGDATAGDNIFTGMLPNPAQGKWTLTVTAEDEFGNRADTTLDRTFEFSLPEPFPNLRR